MQSNRNLDDFFATQAGFDVTLDSRSKCRRVRDQQDRNRHRPHQETTHLVDAAPVIWARDMGRTENERLINYYAGRSFWLFEPEESMAFKPY